MLTTKKLIEAANESYDKIITFDRPNKETYKTGFYEGYLFGERMKKPIVKKKVKTKTTTGRLANVGIGRKNAKTK